MPERLRLMSANVRSYSKSVTDLTPRRRNFAPHSRAVFMAVKLLYGSPTFSHGLPSFFLCVDSYSDNYPVENFQPAVYDGLVPDGEGVE